MEVEREMEGVAGEEFENRKAFCLNLIGSSKTMLASVASGLSVEDLKNFRLASKMCLQASLKTWREKVLISVDCLDLRDDNRKGKQRLRKLADLPLGTDDLLQLAAYPYQNFQFVNWNSFCFGYPHFADFVRKWISSMKYVVLKNARSVIFPTMEFLSRMENLSTLVLIESGFLTPELLLLGTQSTLGFNRLIVKPGFEDFTDSWNLIKFAPRLKTLEVVADKTLMPLRKLQRSMEEYEKNGRGELQLKIRGLLNFEGSSKMFLEADMPLQCVKIYDEAGFKNIHDLLLSKNVGEIEIWRKFSSDPGYIDAFPFHLELPSVVNLRLQGRVIKSLNFLRFMPSLVSVEMQQLHGWEPEKHLRHEFQVDQRKKQLRLRSGDFWENSFYLNKFVEMENLTCFRVDCKFEASSLEEMSSAMPNLQVLSTILTNVTFSVVCANWPCLRELIVESGSMVDDDGIVPTEIGGKSAENLTNLKSLEHFEMKRDASNCSKLTDKSVLQGFLCLPMLKHLLILNSTKMSTSCKEELKRLIQFVIIDEE